MTQKEIKRFVTKEGIKMLLRKDIETIISTPDLRRAFYDLEKAYAARHNSPEENARYKAAFRAFRLQVEGHKGQIIPL